jgi:hypothetical protein
MGPLAVPEKIIGLTRILDFFDRGAISSFTSPATGSVKLLLQYNSAYSKKNNIKYPLRRN